MGIWNTGLYSNDTTADIRDSYVNFLKQQLNKNEAYKKTVAEYKELMGTDEEALFWYALADVQWDYGILMPEVKKNALKFIQKRINISIWEEDPISLANWEKTIQKLKNKICSQMPCEKKIAKTVEFQRNIWNIGDFYAYQFHTDKSVINGLSGKYILFQKIGEVRCFKEKYSVVCVLDEIYDYLPSLETLKNARLLPLVYSPLEKDSPNDIKDYTPSFQWYLQATMIYDKKNDYPKKYFTFIGNTSIEGKEFQGNELTDFYLDKDGMEDWIIDYYLSWRNVNY